MSISQADKTEIYQLIGKAIRSQPGNSRTSAALSDMVRSITRSAANHDVRMKVIENIQSTNSQQIVGIDYILGTYNKTPDAAPTIASPSEGNLYLNLDSDYLWLYYNNAWVVKSASKTLGNIVYDESTTSFWIYTTTWTKTSPLGDAELKTFIESQVFTELQSECTYIKGKNVANSWKIIENGGNLEVSKYDGAAYKLKFFVR
jgi:hypothetical protein